MGHAAHSFFTGKITFDQLIEELASRREQPTRVPGGTEDYISCEMAIMIVNLRNENNRLRAFFDLPPIRLLRYIRRRSIAALHLLHKGSR